MSKLSIGGMGTVYRAEHALIGRLAAVKVLHPELSTNRDIVNRFFNEAKATTSIKHPGIVEVFDFGYMPSGHAFLVMEFLDGMSLARRIDTAGKMSEGDAAMLLRGVCSALAAAHAKGIVHRDLKPDNIFLVPDPDSQLGERPKVLDFGIAKLTDVGLAGTATKTGAVMGTPTYMSPEQCRGAGVVDHRADLYSIGCIFYELLIGRPPFVEVGAGELIGAHLYVEPPRPSELLPTISRESEKLIMQLLSKDPAYRPQTAKELGARFQEIAQSQGWITHTTPASVTAPSMALLTPPPSGTTNPDRAGSREGTVDQQLTLPSEPPGTTTPHEPTTPALFTPSSTPQPEKPTTLSGAASQSIVDVPRRSRKGLGLAMAAAALIAGGTVALFKLAGRTTEPTTATNPATPTATSHATPAATSPATPAATSPATPAATSPATPAATSPATPAATAPIVDTQPAVEARPVVDTKPVVEPLATKPAIRKPAIKPVPKPDVAKPVTKQPDPKQPDPKKPDPKKPLFETEL